MNEFMTKDLYLSSYLLSSGCELKSHDRINGITMFSFIRSSELDELVREYFSSRAMVNPLKYDEAMKALRNMILGPKPTYERTLSSRVTA